MGWRYVPALVDFVSVSASPSTNTEQSVTSKKTNTVKKSSGKECGTVFCSTPRYGTTSRHSTPDHGEAWLTSYMLDSPVNPFPLPENENENPTTDLYGPKSLGFLARYCRDSFSWRTLQSSLMGGSIVFSETWPSSGTMQNGMCFRRIVSAHRNAENASTFWPTVTVQTSNARDTTTTGIMHSGINLIDAVRRFHLEICPNCGEKVTIDPIFTERMQGFPAGWSAIEPLEIQSFPSWLHSHLLHLRAVLSRGAEHDD